MEVFPDQHCLCCQLCRPLFRTQGSYRYICTKCLASKTALLFPEFISLDEYTKELIGSNDPLTQHKYTSAIRELISKSSHPPIAAFIKCGVVPTIVGFLETKYASHPQLQEDALWFLTNLVSSPSISALSVVDERLIVLLVQFMESTHVPLSQQSVWVLGNIVCESVRWRDFALNQNVLVIFKYMLAVRVETFSEKIAWCMSNLCLGQPRPSWDKVKVYTYFLTCLPIANRPITFVNV